MTRLVSRKRGVSVVISTLLVLAITIVGALSISNLMSTSALTTVNQTPKAIVAANSVILTAYDTRDGTSLFNLANFDNKFGDGLCTTISCAPNSNVLPSNDGTDFIVLQVWNKNTNPVPIHSLQINGVQHNWDFNTKNKIFYDGGTIQDFPRDGMFSIIPVSSSPLTQQNSKMVEGDQEVILVVKLSQTIFQENIDLGKPLRILLNVGEEQPSEYIILTGETK